MHEFELIERIVARLGERAAGTGVVVGPGDDAAVLEVPAGHQLVVSTDTLVADRHYPAGSCADAVGYRSLAVAVSDLAAMGAAPAWATVSLATENLTAEWAERYADGLAAAAAAFGLAIVGGNLAKGPQSVTITVHGHVPAGEAITRAGAAPGDGIYVTDRLGGAALALGDETLAECSLADFRADSPLARYWRPQPRLAIGARLRGTASAAIDLSDGLSSDLEHICRASGVCADVDLDRVPLYPGAAALAAIAAGDDYELAFTAPAGSEPAIEALGRDAGVGLTRIGTMGEGERPRVCWRRDGVPIAVARATDISEGEAKLHWRDLRSPSALVATGFGCGFAPIAPGTVGSLAGVAIWWFLLADLDYPMRTAVAVAAWAVAAWLVERLVVRRGLGDEPAIVVDEVVGVWFALLLAPKSILWAGIAFVLFRVADIAKPWPVSWIDRRIAGGLGIMADDLVAGIIAAVVATAAWTLLG